MKWKLECFSIILVMVCAQASFAQQSIPLRGSWDFGEKKFLIDVNSGTDNPIRVNVKRTSDQIYDVEFSFTNWKIGFLNISTILKGSLKIRPDKDGSSYISGRVASQYTLVNKQVFNDITADFFIQNQVLVIKSLNIGQFSSSGKVALKVNPAIDFNIEFSRLSLKDLFAFLNRTNIFDARGDITGKIKVKGPWDHFQIQGEAHSLSGFVDQHKYSSAEIHFEGTYPKVKLYNSQIAQIDGFSFAVQGAIDLSDLNNIEKQIKSLETSPLVTENGAGWDWTLKRIKSEEGGGTTEFKYMLRKDGDEEDGLLGIEKRMKF